MYVCDVESTSEKSLKSRRSSGNLTQRLLLDPDDLFDEQHLHSDVRSLESGQQERYIQHRNTKDASKDQGPLIVVQATLVTDPTKRLMVEIASNQKISYLKLMIAEAMQDDFAMFSRLQNVRVLNLTKKNGKRQELPEEGLIGDHLIDGEEVYFKGDSLNLWLKINFRLFVQPTAQPMVEGNIELRVDKEEKMSQLKKKL